MSNENTPRLDLPYLMPSQAQKHVTHNEALSGIDELTQLSVQSRSQASPPTNPDADARFLVPVGASGDWKSQDGKLAAQRDGAWEYHTPRLGWRLWLEDEALFVLLDKNDTWITLAGSSNAGISESVNKLGISATANDTNRLTVASASTLLTAASDSHRLTINKTSVSDTASIVLQNAFSGRAEIGLTGNDDLSFKVSGDGSAFSTALSVDPQTASVSFPNSPTFVVTLSMRYYLFADLRWVTSSDDNYGTAYYNATESGGTGIDPIIEWEHLGHFLTKGTRIHAIDFVGRTNTLEVQDLELYFFSKHPSGETHWSTGYNSDALNVVTPIHRDNFFSPLDGGVSHSGSINHIHKRSLSTNFVMPEDGYFSVFVKPVGNLNATRFFLSTMTLKCSF